MRRNVVRGLADHLVEMVVKACCESLEGVAGGGKAVVRLLGGWLAWPEEAWRLSACVSNRSRGDIQALIAHGEKFVGCEE